MSAWILLPRPKHVKSQPTKFNIHVSSWEFLSKQQFVTEQVSERDIHQCDRAKLELGVCIVPCGSVLYWRWFDYPRTRVLCRLLLRGWGDRTVSCAGCPHSLGATEGRPMPGWLFLHRRDSGAIALSCRNLLCRRKLGASAMPGGHVQHAEGAGAMLAVSGGIFVQPGRGSGLCTGNVLRDGGAV